MTYLTHFNDSHYSLIREVMPKVEQLSPGRAAEIDCQTPTRRNRARFILYSWFRYNNLSSQYTLKCEGQNILRIVRKDDYGNLKVSIPDQERAGFVQEFLIDILDESEALAVCEAEGLTGTELVETIVEWKRVQGL